MLTEETNLGGRAVAPQPIQKVEIGVDRNNELVKSLVNLADSSSLNVNTLQNMTNISQSREQIYQLIDVMAADSDIASVIEAYVDEICEPNDNGDIIWVESSNPDVLKFISFIMDSMNINKHIRNYTTKLVKYGDLYFRLFQESESEKVNDIFNSEDDILLNHNKHVLNEKIDDAKKVYDLVNNTDDTVFVNEDSRSKLVEDVKVVPLDNKAHFDFYIEAERNPAEFFELIKHGKTAGFIKAPTDVLDATNNQASPQNYYYKYNVKADDVTLYSPMNYVHAYIEDNSSRVPEEVVLSTDTDTDSYTYSVRRGQSLLYNSYKVWRELKLLETSVLLNRLTKSSVIRILEVEVGNLPDTQIKSVLSDIKSMIEQKSAINVGTSMSEYTMPGPVENTIYLPTRGDIGKINIQELGINDVDPKSLLDLDYFNNKMYGSLRVPKAFFNFTDDGAGFNGGESLAILSGRFGKAVKRIQTIICQAITDVINIFLIDRGLEGYINKFTVKMQAPITKEELDRKEAEANEVNLIRDLMGVIRDDVDDPKIRLEMLKILLQSAPQSSDLIALIEDMIKKIENGETADSNSETSTEINDTTPSATRGLKPMDIDTDDVGTENEADLVEPENSEVEQAEPTAQEDNYLPTFDEMGVEDATDLSNNA